MFELIIYTLFYLVFPTAPDISTLPSDVQPWQPTYFQAAHGHDLAIDDFDAPPHDPCEYDLDSCLEDVSALSSFLENPVAFILEG